MKRRCWDPFSPVLYKSLSFSLSIVNCSVFRLLFLRLRFQVLSFRGRKRNSKAFGWFSFLYKGFVSVLFRFHNLGQTSFSFFFLILFGSSLNWLGVLTLMKKISLFFERDRFENLWILLWKCLFLTKSWMFSLNLLWFSSTKLFWRRCMLGIINYFFSLRF